MLRVAFFTILERKLLGYLQCRKGPNKPGLAGLLVPFADAMKLLTKERRQPKMVNKTLFYCVPCLTIAIPLFLWRTYPSIYALYTFKFSVLFFVCVSSVGVYALLGAGWGRNRKYSLLGAVRSVAQSVSYEVRLFIIVTHFIVFFFYGFLTGKLRTLCRFLFLPILLLFITSLAETNRSPFDFSEGESELVRGYNTEYSSVPFVMIFLAEYISIIYMAAVIGLLYNMNSPFDVFFYVILWGCLMIWCRGTLPRLRYDQLIWLAWKCFLPTVLCSARLIVCLCHASIHCDPISTDRRTVMGYVGWRSWVSTPLPTFFPYSLLGAPV